MVSAAYRTEQHKRRKEQVLTTGYLDAMDSKGDTCQKNVKHNNKLKPRKNVLNTI